MSTLAEKKQQITEQITVNLWHGKRAKAENLALQIAMEDKEFEALVSRVEEAKQHIQTFEQFESDRAEIARRQSEAEAEAARLVVERDAMIDDFDNRIIEQEGIVKACRDRDGNAHEARCRVANLANGKDAVPGLFELLPEALQKLIRREESAWERNRRRQILQRDLEACRVNLRGLEHELQEASGKIDSHVDSEIRNDRKSLCEALRRNCDGQAEVIKDLENQLAELNGDTVAK